MAFQALTSLASLAHKGPWAGLVSLAAAKGVNPLGGIRLSINIRKEQPSDVKSIHEVTVTSFLEAPHTDHTEQFIVKTLRESGALTISLVAEDKNYLKQSS